MDADTHIKQINWWADHDLPMECYWMDAGWTDGSEGWVAHQSRQDPDKKLFPKGLRPISDAAHRRGMKYLLWFVPDSLWPGVGIDHSSLRFPHMGIDYMIHHLLSHTDSDDWLKVNQFFTEQMAYIAGKLDAIQEGERTALDNSMVMLCSSMLHGNHDNMQLIN